MNTRISLIVPVLNEQACITEQLRRLCALERVAEILVVDGGSSDETRGLVSQAAARTPRLRLLSSQRGRAQQMNVGAAAASGDVLWFVHADVQPPASAPEAIERALQTASVVAGAFRTWTLSDADGPWWAPLMHLADLRSRYSGLPYGDQCLFVRREIFEALGGFAPLPLMEDLELSQRLVQAGRLRILRPSVRVSGRRFEARPLFHLAVMNSFPLLFRLGVPARALARFYRDVR